MSLRGIVPPDPQTSVSQVRYAVIFTPRQDRKRYPAGCVEIFESEEASHLILSRPHALAKSGVRAPSKSSEGQFIYYLLDWLV